MNDDLRAAMGSLTPRMRQTLVAAHRIAASRDMEWTGTEHVLLAMLADAHGIAGQTLSRLGCVENVRSELHQILDDPAYRVSSNAVSRRDADS